LTLRRGLVAIGGACGDFVGANMIAGTVLVFGPCGIRPAAAMRRGTVGLLGDNPPSILVTFRKSCVCQPTFLRVILRRLESLGLPCRASATARTTVSITAITSPLAAARFSFARLGPRLRSTERAFLDTAPRVRQ
jgi:hypothetical protein